MVDCIVTTGGGIEEDFIKCLSDFHLGDFYANDIEMRQKALNRIGNIVVPSSSYCKFEDWLIPNFYEMYAFLNLHSRICLSLKQVRGVKE